MRSEPLSLGSVSGRAELDDNPTNRVYERLRERIVWGQLAPGARLVEREIAARMGTSRTPVRSALQRLQQERYVAVAGGGRSTRLVVAPLTMDDARELLELVGSLEAAAGRRAALQPRSTRLSVTIRLAEVNNALRLAAEQERPDLRELFDLDTAFHRTYVEAGAGPRILALHDVIKPQAERYCWLYMSALADRIEESTVEHEAIVDAIRHGDPDATERAVHGNWRSAADRFSEVIAKLGERGTW